MPCKTWPLRPLGGPSSLNAWRTVTGAAALGGSVKAAHAAASRKPTIKENTVAMLWHAVERGVELVPAVVIAERV